MKKSLIFALMIVMVIALITLLKPCFAEDGNNVPDQIGDIFSGKGNGYGGLELNHIPLPFIPGPATMTLWGDARISEVPEGEKREVKGGFIIAVDWRDIFH